ncbi:hypothetical protein BS78_10G116500 [Paspalum vaginatum]|nr:hypothetical protein BS78_10G116500 [Paspalum vaginatum]
MDNPLSPPEASKGTKFPKQIHGYEKAVSTETTAWLVSKKKELGLKKQLCHKKPPDTNFSGFYVCKFLRINGRCRTNPEDVPPIPRKESYPTERDLMNVVADLSCFLIHKMVHIRGDYFHPESDLAAMIPACKFLREWENQGF